MPRQLVNRLLLTIALVSAPAIAPAQEVKPKPDSAAKMGSMDDHMMGPWKELNAFHHVMAATWHPASKDDLAPLRAKIKDLVTAADAWSASKAPAMPASCGSEAVRKAVTKVSERSRSLAALVASSAGDAQLKESLKAIHDTFEVAEKGCAAHGGHGS